MTILQHVQKQEQKRRALAQAQFLHAKAYRGVPYSTAPSDASPHTTLTYRGVQYDI